MSHRSAALPIVACAAAMACFQYGAAAAKPLFLTVGPIGATALRLLLSALIMLALSRPWRSWPAKAPLGAIIGLGASVAGALLFYYLAIARLPMGIAMPVQFLGPLILATCLSRGLSDLLWVACAGAGIVCLVGLGGALGGGAPVDPLGLVYALCAGASWAGYILCGKAAGQALGTSAAAVSLGIAALFVLPLGLAQNGLALFAPSVLPLALLVAVVSAAIPFALELYAMPRLPTRTFSVLMSLEPAFAVIAGLFFLGERLSALQIFGVALVIGASIGSVATIEARKTG